MKKRSIVAVFGLALLLILAISGVANAAKPTVYWHKADISISPVESDSYALAGAIMVDWTEPQSVPYGYTISLDGPTSYHVSVPWWAPRPIQILGSNLAPGKYKMLIVAYDSTRSLLDQIRGHFVYPIN